MYIMKNLAREYLSHVSDTDEQSTVIKSYDNALSLLKNHFLSSDSKLTSTYQ